MIKPTKPLHSPLEGKNYTAPSGLCLSVLENEAQFILQLSIADLGRASTVFGIELPAIIGGFAQGHLRSALCVGPEEWVLSAPLDQAQAIIGDFAALEKQAPHSLVDISYRQVGFVVSGPGAADLLNAGCPLDLQSIPVGTGTRTVFDKAQITLLKIGDNEYRLDIIRSFSPFVWELLETVAKQVEAEILLNSIS